MVPGAHKGRHLQGLGVAEINMIGMFFYSSFQVWLAEMQQETTLCVVGVLCDRSAHNSEKEGN